MSALVRKFSTSAKVHKETLPVLYIQELEDKIFYCVAHPDTGEPLFIEASEVTKISMKQE